MKTEIIPAKKAAKYFPKKDPLTGKPNKMARKKFIASANNLSRKILFVNELKAQLARAKTPHDRTLLQNKIKTAMLDYNKLVQDTIKASTEKHRNRGAQKTGT